jgi:hypothetical protein
MAEANKQRIADGSRTEWFWVGPGDRGASCGDGFG